MVIAHYRWRSGVQRAAAASVTCRRDPMKLADTETRQASLTCRTSARGDIARESRQRHGLRRAIRSDTPLPAAARFLPAPVRQSKSGRRETCQHGAIREGREGCRQISRGQNKACGDLPISISSHSVSPNKMRSCQARRMRSIKLSAMPPPTEARLRRRARAGTMPAWMNPHLNRLADGCACGRKPGRSSRKSRRRSCAR